MAFTTSPSCIGATVPATGRAVRAGQRRIGSLPTMSTRGLLGAAGYLPHRRLDRSTIAAVAGSGGGRGTRSGPSYGEDTTTLGAPADRAALRPRGGEAPHTLGFSTVPPACHPDTQAPRPHTPP